MAGHPRWLTIAAIVFSLVLAGLTASVLCSFIPGFWYSNRIVQLLVLAVMTLIFSLIYHGLVFSKNAVQRTKKIFVQWLLYILIFLGGSGVVLLGLWRLGVNLPVPPGWHQLEVSYAEAENPNLSEVVLLQMDIGSETRPLAFLEPSGGWRLEARYDYADSYWTQSPGSLRYSFKTGAFEKISLLFYTSPGDGVVRLHLDRQEQVVSLSETVAGNRLVTFNINSMPAWVAWMVVQVVVLTGLGLAMAAIIRIIAQVNPRSIYRGFLSVVNGWYEDTTPNFEKLVLITLGLSGLLTLFLFIEPLISHRTYPEIEPSGANPVSSVIVIVTDALSAQDMSVYGYDLPTTPNLEAITQDWTIYRNAQASQNCTTGMLPSVLTGRYPYTTINYKYGDWTAAKPGWVNLSQVLTNAGYQTWWDGYLTPGVYRLGSGLSHFIAAPSQPLELLVRTRFKGEAITKAKGQAFIPWPLLKVVNIRFNSFGLSLGNFIQNYPVWRQEATLKPPYFIYYHFGGAHGPNYIGGSRTGLFLPKDDGMFMLADRIAVYGKYDLAVQPQVDRLRLRYDEAIRNVDDQFLALFKVLSADATYDSSLIIITADHGQNFYNGYSSHCTPLIAYGETHVPLLIKYPYQDIRQEVHLPVSTVDLAPTILDALGYAYPTGWFDGQSLLALAQNPEVDRIVFSRRLIPGRNQVEVIAATDGRYRYVVRAQLEQVFDYIKDPAEQNNLLPAMQADPRIVRLRQAIINYQDRANQLLHGANILSLPPLTP